MIFIRRGIGSPHLPDTVCAHRRTHSAELLGYNFSVGRLGRLYRSVRDRGGNRRRDGRLLDDR